MKLQKLFFNELDINATKKKYFFIHLISIISSIISRTNELTQIMFFHKVFFTIQKNLPVLNDFGREKKIKKYF